MTMRGEITTITEIDLHRFFQRQRQLDTEWRFTRGATYGPHTTHEADTRDPRRLLADASERHVITRLVTAGYHVSRTGHNDRCDLVVEHCLRIEVKASSWVARLGGNGRYQMQFHNRADVLCWNCVDAGRWFVIPVVEIGSRTNLAVFSLDPAAYSGQWARFLGAWALIDQMVAEACRAGIGLDDQPRLI